MTLSQPLFAEWASTGTARNTHSHERTTQCHKHPHTTNHFAGAPLTGVASTFSSWKKAPLAQMLAPLRSSSLSFELICPGILIARPMFDREQHKKTCKAKRMGRGGEFWKMNRRQGAPHVTLDAREG